MKQEHEMTPGVLVSGDDMSAGDYKARCAVLEAELANHKRLQAETERLQAEAASARIVELLNRIVPRIDAGGPNPIDPDMHHCEWTLHRERERIHAEFAEALAQQGKDNN